MTSPSSELDLLLSYQGESTPVLASGLPESALASAPAPARGPTGTDSMHLEALDRDPNDLEAQRWAVIAPEGEAGDAALAAIAALIDLRREQQGADPTIFRVPDGMDTAASVKWKHDVLRSEDVPADERPRYLLILGDIDRVSLELQHVIANGSFVGRLHCPSAKGYGEYAEKVVAHEARTSATRARALYYTVQDGTAAIGAGYRHLVEPCMRMTSDLVGRGKLAAEPPIEVPHSEWGPDELLAVAGIDEPSLLVSLSHGLGPPRRGWRSPDEQRALQGALSLGSEDPLSADVVRQTPFLPGGVWFCVACYGAGTPPASAFHPWLSLLAERGGSRDHANAVLRALPRPGERPFVAALPQALLANPNGPLAVIGHMDLAWTFGFTDPGGKRSRASRMHAAQRAIAGGSRVGVGLDALMHAYREVNDELMACYQQQREAAARGRPDPLDPRRLGDVWMQRNDLRGYVLLGDPAARLAVPGEQRRMTEAATLSDRPGAAATKPRARSVPEVMSRESAPTSVPTLAPTTLVAPHARPIDEAPPPPVASPPPQSLAVQQHPPPPTVAVQQQPPPPPPSVAVQQPPPSPPPLVAAQPRTPPPAPSPASVHPASAPSRSQTPERPEVDLRERAVLAMLRGDEPPRDVAARFGLPLDELYYWLDVYREAGRRALGG